MNDENLLKGKATQFKSGENAARNGRKGGIASGKAKREKARIRKRLEMMLDNEIPNKELTYEEQMIKTLLTIAGSPSYGTAAVKAFQTIAHILGEDEPEPETQDYDSDGFIEALNNQADETMNEAGDIVEE